MSTNSMQVWKTGLSLTQTEIYDTLNTFFQSDVFTDYWADIDKETTGQVDYYITDNIFLRVINTGNSHGIIPYCGATTGSAINFSIYSNVSIYKVGYCMIICSNGAQTYSALTDYSKVAKIIIDSLNSGEGKSLFYNLGTTGSSTLFDSSSLNPMTLYTPYISTYSLKTSTDLAQIAPLKNNILGKGYDNLYGVLLTPSMNSFVSFAGQKWFFTSGVALLAGNEVPTPIYLDTVSSS